MTLREAERITGCDIWLDDKSERYRFVAYNEQGLEVSSQQGPKIGETLKSLVEDIYRARSEVVRKRQEYRCLWCAKRVPLSIDHIIPRSKGRNDRYGNLRALCNECHEARHRKKQEVIRGTATTNSV